MNATTRWRAAATVADCGRIDAQGPANSARDYVRVQLAALIDGFALNAQRTKILDTYDAIFRRSLDFPLGACPRVSRLTEDGTPIQFATIVGAPGPRLRFVGDASLPGETGIARMRTARAAAEEVAGIIGIGTEFDALRDLLGVLVPEDNHAALADPAGALWIGAAFAPGAAAQVRVYVNGNLGGGTTRRRRMATLATYFGQSSMWAMAEAHLSSALLPLGMALTLAPGQAAKGALYFRAFGLRLEEYTALTQKVAGTTNAEAIAGFGIALLREEARYPTASAVLSLSFNADSTPTIDLEFCAHCLFGDDTEARDRLLGLFSAVGVDAGPYQTLAKHLLSDVFRAGPPRIHSFVGVDAKSAGPAFSVYMKPDLAPRRWSI